MIGEMPSSTVIVTALVGVLAGALIAHDGDPLVGYVIFPALCWAMFHWMQFLSEGRFRVPWPNLVLFAAVVIVYLQRVHR